MDYNNYDVSQLVDKFVKIIVVSKTDLYAFDKFIDRIQSINTYELKIAETFGEFLGENVSDEEISVEDTTELLDTYVDSVETDLDKDKIKSLMRGLYVEAQDLELV